ncbi:TPA: phage N-6-adenine-methyltransferase [Escherichia coli]|nr:phage N-6-adenine-methyltransferase [Escherichia coli]HAM4950093.1 phage N-6-adenine-methyltransferase [Escherichia coli]HAM5072134.1 phage N-6-adenine-methyltransferase [Escherichia coli]HAM5373507.1 phage N-6-adenine-methyltransferase [Escherichia coli]HAM5470627.1 phage N-6-adenine-methyltransferase [Escherichia coli]
MTIKSNTPAHDKDCWQTPLWLFDALDIEFGFWLDSAASDKNALCAHWLTEADDALNSEWVSHGAIWNTLRKYQQANAVYADEAAKLKNTRLKNVLMKGDLTPEVVNNMLFSKNKSEIKTLYNSVGRVGRAQMRNGIIGKAMEKSGGSPDQFLRQLNILQNQTGITFKGQDAAYLKGLKNYLQSTQQAAKAAVTTPTGQQTIPFIIGYGTAMNPATTGAAVSYGLLTRAYESEPFRNAMLRMASTPRGSTAFEKAMQQAQKAINALTQGAKSDALSE